MELGFESSALSARSSSSCETINFGVDAAASLTPAHSDGASNHDHDNHHHHHQHPHNHAVAASAATSSPYATFTDAKSAISNSCSNNSSSITSFPRSLLLNLSSCRYQSTSASPSPSSLSSSSASLSVSSSSSSSSPPCPPLKAATGFKDQYSFSDQIAINAEAECHTFHSNPKLFQHPAPTVHEGQQQHQEKLLFLRDDHDHSHNQHHLIMPALMNPMCSHQQLSLMGCSLLPSSASPSPPSPLIYSIHDQQSQHQEKLNDIRTSLLLSAAACPPLAPSFAARAANSVQRDYNLNAGIGRSFFTPEQWVEFTQQTYVFKHLVAGVVPPTSLLIPIINSVSALSRLGASTAGLFHPGLKGTIDPEPGRCRRTDGKKWRCAREVVPDQKYCERHIHRGRHRARAKNTGSAANNDHTVQSMPSLNSPTSLSSNPVQPSTSVSTITGVTNGISVGNGILGSSGPSTPFSNNASVHSSVCNSPAASARPESQPHFALQSTGVTSDGADGATNLRYNMPRDQGITTDNGSLSRLINSAVSSKLSLTHQSSMMDGDPSNENTTHMRPFKFPHNVGLGQLDGLDGDQACTIAAKFRSEHDNASATFGGGGRERWQQQKPPAFPFNLLESVDNSAAGAGGRGQDGDGWPGLARGKSEPEISGSIEARGTSASTLAWSAEFVGDQLTKRSRKSTDLSMATFPCSSSDFTCRPFSNPFRLSVAKSGSDTDRIDEDENEEDKAVFAVAAISPAMADVAAAGSADEYQADDQYSHHYSHVQQPPHWVPIAWDSPIIGGPLAEVLHSTSHGSLTLAEEFKWVNHNLNHNYNHNHNHDHDNCRSNHDHGQLVGKDYRGSLLMASSSSPVAVLQHKSYSDSSSSASSPRIKVELKDAISLTNQS